MAAVAILFPTSLFAQEPPLLSPASPFGMGIYFGNRYSPDDMKRAAALALDAGIRWNREEFTWSIVEPSKGGWVWDQHDAAVRVASEHGISSFGLLVYSAPWAASAPEGADNRNTYPPANLADFEEYVFQVVSRYKSSIKHWEIWNEPNIKNFWKPEPDPAAYARLLSAGQSAVKRAAPTALVLGMDTSCLDLPFIEEVFKNGGADLCDVITTHPYRTHVEEDFRRDMTDLRELMAKYGLEKPIWFTEVGWPTSGKKSVTEGVQSQQLVRLYVLSLALGIERICAYDFRDDCEDPEERECHFGILHKDWTPKPAYNAFSVMAHKLEGLHYDHSLGNPPVEVHCFKGEDEEVWVAWNPDERSEVGIPLTTPTARITTLVGEKTDAACEKGLIKVSLSDSPVYVEGIK